MAISMMVLGSGSIQKILCKGNIMIEKNVVCCGKPTEEIPKVLVICGTHGDETAAIKTCWYLFNKIQQSNAKDGISYKFIFMANENAVRNHTRGYCNENPESCNLNRAFDKPIETFEDIVNHIKKVVDEWEPAVVIDVHNSTACANTVLIDYGKGSRVLMDIANKYDLNPMLRTSQNFGTIKRYCIEKGIPAFTVEMSPMFMEFNNCKVQHKNVSYLERVISAGFELNSGYKVNSCSFADSKYLTKDIVCPLSACIVEWSKLDPYDVYEQNECICALTDIENEEVLNIYAPCKLMVQDICCPDVAFEGYPILEYSPLD